MAVGLDLDQVMSRLNALPEKERRVIEERAAVELSKRKFIPSPGPQTAAYFSKADVLLYGGQAGGGKSALLCGLALEEHKRTLLMRRQGTDLVGGGGLIEELLKLNGGRDGFNGSPPQTLRTRDGRVITFGSARHLGDEQSYQGRPRDLLGVDEATQFLEAQIRFLMGWVRSEDPEQRTRTILATNPPVDSTGDWVIGMFRPWLDLTHPNPAEPAELRWYMTMPDGTEEEVDGPTPREFDGKVVYPLSRTFIPASLDDNPYLRETNYRAQLDALPEPLRSAMRDGNFMLAREDSEWQVIPTQWVIEAQQRWTKTPPEHSPMTALAVDVAQGGADQTVLAARYDGWFEELEAIPGSETPDGPSVAGRVVARRRNGCAVVIDMGGGWGGSAYDHLKHQPGYDRSLIRYVGAEKSSKRTADNTLGFYNKRAEAWWRLREALDPSQEQGSPIALPDDPELRADLTSPTFDTTTGKIRVEPKEKLVSRLGRSPDKGDAVVMAWFGGPRLQTHGNMWRGYRDQNAPGGRPKVVVSRPNARRK